MAEETKAHLLKYTGDGLNSILERADTVIKTAQNNQKYYIRPYEGGIGPEVPAGNSVLLGGDDNKINTVSSTPGAFYSSIEGRAPQFGTLPVQYGGTGTTTYSALRKTLGLGENTTGALKVENGGTGITNPTPNKILATTLGAYGYISPLAAGTVLVSNGPDELPTFKTIESISATTNFGTINTGTWQGEKIAVAYGGTGVDNLDDLSVSLGLNTTTTPIEVSRGGTGVNNLNELKKNLAIQFTDISMDSSIVSEENGGTGYTTLQEAFDNKVKINLEISSNIEGILPTARGGIGKNNLQEAFNEQVSINLETAQNISGILPTNLGGTGMIDFIIDNKINPNYLISDIITINENTTLDKSANNCFVQVLEPASIITLPSFSTNTEYEVEIFFKSINSLTINCDVLSNIYYTGATSGVKSVKTINSYSTIGVKYLGNNDWLITGEVE